MSADSPSNNANTATTADDPTAEAKGESVDFAPGTVIGRYRIESMLGQGGMGAVYRAEHTLIKRTVALKVIRPHFAKRPGVAERFLREVQASIELAHPHIVTAHDVDIDSATGVAYMTMELIDGNTLDEIVRQSGPFDPLTAAKVIRQIAEALAFAADQSVPIVHRDIKPQNIMLTRDSRSKLLDLGLARFLDDDLPPVDLPQNVSILEQTTIAANRLTNAGSLLGTVPYMAPEQAIDACNADSRSDIYSLGCTFYFLLSGRKAFDAGSIDDILEKKFSGVFEPLSGVMGDAYEAGLDEIVQRMIAAEPGRRFQSPWELIAELDRWMTAASPKQGDDIRNLPLTDLRDRLLSAGLIRRRDWDTVDGLVAESAFEDTWATTVYTPAPQQGHNLMKPAANATDALLRLQRVPTGLTDYQVKQILAGNLDRLRIGHRVIVDQLGASWKGELFTVRNKSASDRLEAMRTHGFWALGGLHGADEERRDQFLKYFARVAAVRHPHLEEVYEVGLAADNIGFVATELISGQPLSKTVKSVPLESEQDRVQWISDVIGIASGVAELHQASILHLDISPDTVRADPPMYRRRGRGVAKLSGAGLRTLVAANAAFRNSADRQSAFGNLGTMAPELWLDPDSVGAHTDVFAIGATLYFSLTGVYPYFPQEAEALSRLTFDEIGQRMSSLYVSSVLSKQTLPASIKPLLRDALEPNPQRRCGTLREFLELANPIRDEIYKVECAKRTSPKLPSEQFRFQQEATTDKRRWWQFWRERHSR